LEELPLVCVVTALTALNEDERKLVDGWSDTINRASIEAGEPEGGGPDRHDAGIIHLSVTAAATAATTRTANVTCLILHRSGRRRSLPAMASARRCDDPSVTTM
jgi:hypothetical protein